MIPPNSVESSDIIRTNFVELSSRITDSGSKSSKQKNVTSKAKSSNVISEVVEYVEEVSS